MTYVFRNNTIEPFFDESYVFSGYGDISTIPNAERYIWWYQLPYKYDFNQIVRELISYKEMLQYVSNKIHTELIVFSLVNQFTCSIETGNVGLIDAIDEFNKVARELTCSSNVKFIDFSEFTTLYGNQSLVDWKYYYTAQYPYSPKLIRPFKLWWKKKMCQISMSRKKCLVLDLDNTLWGGILGEDGVTNIKMSGDYPGKAFHYWQEGIKELQRNGVILAICSKNNMSDVEEVWNKRDDILLHRDDFATIRINWKDKATNIREIASELNIGLDSMVFVDDNPVERELIRTTLPMVAVPDYPEHPYNLPLLYEKLVNDYFSVYKLTLDDVNKTYQYISNAQRIEESSKYDTVEDYLSSLNMHLRILPVSEITIPRAAQMTQKTNQFNLCTRRYTENDLRLLLDSNANMWTLSVSDRFGDNGITGLIIVTNDERIDTFLMSCRVLGRGLEYAFATYVLQQLKALGVDRVIGEFIPTAKNIQVKNFWPQMHFKCIEEREDGYAKYSLDLSNEILQIKDCYSIN